MLFAANIQSIMKMKGFDPASLGRAAGMNRTGIYDILSGKSKNPRLDTVEKIAAALEVSPSALFVDTAIDELQSQLYGVLMELTDHERDRLLLTARAWASHTAPQAPA
jgi:transcriptional regulator with XRE-family HTH domain